MTKRWIKRGEIDPNRSSVSLAAEMRSPLYRLLAISRLEPKAPNDNRQDRETRGPCAATRALPVRFRHPDLQDRHRRFSGAQALFATSPCPADETTCDRSFLAMVCL